MKTTTAITNYQELTFKAQRHYCGFDRDNTNQIQPYDIGGPLDNNDFNQDIEYYRNYVLRLAKLDSPYQKILTEAIQVMHDTNYRVSRNKLRKLFVSICAWGDRERYERFITTMQNINQTVIQKAFTKMYAIYPFYEHYLNDNGTVDDFNKLETEFYAMAASMFGLMCIDKNSNLNLS